MVSQKTKKTTGNKKYSDDDLIRKPCVRTIILGVGLLSLIIGTKHLAYFGINPKGGFVGLFGLFLIYMLHTAYEDLLEEAKE